MTDKQAQACPCSQARTNDQVKQAKPDWLRVKYKQTETKAIQNLMDQLSLNTVCRAANCPNLGECFKSRTATFMIMGDICTRNCSYCNVATGRPLPLDPEEPRHVAEAAKELGLKHLVVTSVDRDDLPDGGASHFADMIYQTKKLCPETTIEVLIPDFKGNPEALQVVLEAGPDVLNHNIETVREVFPIVRRQGSYDLSLELLARAKKYAETHDNLPLIKSGFMVGLGETDQQITRLFQDLHTAGCDIVTIGQYLQPTRRHHPLARYVTPEEFEAYRQEAMAIGFSFVAASPLVRSSYKAAEALDKARQK